MRIRWIIGGSKYKYEDIIRWFHLSFFWVRETEEEKTRAPGRLYSRTSFIDL
jgi:hypothetical protein